MKKILIMEDGHGGRRTYIQMPLNGRMWDIVQYEGGDITIIMASVYPQENQEEMVFHYDH